MNYERNYLYFKNPKLFNFLIFFIFLALIGGLAYLYFDGFIEDIFLYVLGGVLFLLGIVLSIIFPLRRRISDQYIDKQVQEAVIKFEKMAINKLALKPTDDSNLKPVRYYSFINNTDYKHVNIMSRLGRDDITRTSQCRLVCHFYTDKKFVVYHYEFSLIRPWIAEGYTSYYYSEIAHKKIIEVNTDENPYLQIEDNVNK
jgi:hypothetical protein